MQSFYAGMLKDEAQQAKVNVGDPLKTNLKVEGRLIICSDATFYADRAYGIAIYFEFSSICSSNKRKEVPLSLSLQRRRSGCSHLRLKEEQDVTQLGNNASPKPGHF